LGTFEDEKGGAAAMSTTSTAVAVVEGKAAGTAAAAAAATMTPMVMLAVAMWQPMKREDRVRSANNRESEGREKEAMEIFKCGMFFFEFFVLFAVCSLRPHQWTI
jgi:hypothetical protein